MPIIVMTGPDTFKVAQYGENPADPIVHISPEEYQEGLSSGRFYDPPRKQASSPRQKQSGGPPHKRNGDRLHSPQHSLSHSPSSEPLLQQLKAVRLSLTLSTRTLPIGRFRPRPTSLRMWTKPE